MDKHLIDIFVPHRKLRPLYYLSAGLLVLLWIPNLNKLNIPLPTKVLETWFLDKLLLTTIVLLILYSLSTYLVTYYFKAEIKSPSKEQSNKEKTKQINQTQEEVMLEQIIFHILKLRGANETASPKRIAALMHQDTGVINAYMWKLHNEQYMTFKTGGATPTVDTDFFLSPKAFDIVKLGGT